MEHDLIQILNCMGPRVDHDLKLQICKGYGHVMTLPPPGIDTDTLPSSEPDESSNFYYDHNDDDQDQDDQVI